MTARNDLKPSVLRSSHTRRAREQMCRDCFDASSRVAAQTLEAPPIKASYRPTHRLQERRHRAPGAYEAPQRVISNVRRRPRILLCIREAGCVRAVCQVSASGGSEYPAVVVYQPDTIAPRARPSVTATHVISRFRRRARHQQQGRGVLSSPRRRPVQWRRPRLHMRAVYGRDDGDVPAK